MALHINDGWKVLVAALGLSLVGCGGAALEGQDSLGHSAQGLDGAVTLTMNGDAEMTLECGVDAWSDPGASATDGDGNPLAVQKYNSGDDDGDGVPGAVDPDDYGPGPDAHAEALYYVQYLAWDADYNIDGAIRSVLVHDTRTPTLTLNGDETITYPCGSNYDYSHDVTATDECYGDLSGSVSRTGEVNGWVEGSYTLVYSVSDGAGHAAPSVTRTVNVVDCPWNR
jgi:hypothetical protein